MAKRRRGLYNQAHAQVNRDARAMERAREGGYGALDTAISRLYKRLSSTQRGQASKLTSSNARSLDLILKATARSRASNRRLVQTTNQGLAAYGSAGGMLTQAMGQIGAAPRRAADLAASEGKATRKATRSLDKTAQGLIELTKAHTSEAQANADQLAVDELNRRTTSDLGLIAQQHHDIAMQKLQAQQAAEQAQREFENAKKLAILNQRLATQGVDPTNAKMVSTAVGTMGNIAAQAMTFKAMAPGTTPDVAIDAITGRLPGYAEMSANEQSAINQIIMRVFTDDEPGIDPVANEVMSIIRSQPGWDKLGQGKKDHLRDWIRNQINAAIPAEWLKQKATAETQEEDPDAPHDWVGEQIGGLVQGTWDFVKYPFSNF